jgi:Gpi18-like mannosyltransferase
LIILIFLIWRILLFIPLNVADRYIPYRAGYEYTNIWYFTPSYSPVDNPALYPHANFDGVHYLSIAAKGYQDNERFFPLYPILISFTSKLFGSKTAYDTSEFFTALLLSNIFFLLSLIFLYKLLLLDFKEKVARSTLLYIILFPASFFFVSVYSESLFLLLIILSFYSARQKNWLLASIFGLLVGATRPLGIAIIPALIFEFYKGEAQDKKLFFRKILPLLLLPLGFIAYMIFNFFRNGNALHFLKGQTELGNSRSITALVFPLQTMYRYIKILLTVPHIQYEWWIALLEIISFIFALLLIYQVWKKLRTSYFIFSLISFLIPTFSGTFSGLPRYILVLFPLFVALALVKNRFIKSVYLLLSILLLLILFIFFARGYYVA